MKNWWISILAILVFTSSFQSSLVLIDYHINQDFYETHCENKDKPELSCHGKCQLKKESSNNNEILLVAKFCFEMNLLPTEKIEIGEIQQKFAVEIQQNFNNYQAATSNGYFYKIPHPPQV